MSEETKKVPFKDTMAGPTVVLLLICLVVSGALALVYQVTAPAIAKINAQKAAEARQLVLPEADGFKPFEGKLPEGVIEYYLADNGSGVVVTAQNKSFGGTLTLMVGFDNEGSITGVSVTKHVDTPGVGTKAMTPDYLEQYKGITKLDDVGGIKLDSQVDEVTGSTVSSNGVYGAVKNAIAAYSEIGMGGGK